jgi:hypothetical protein
MKITDKDPERHHHIEYPMELAAPPYAPVPVESQKDEQRNVARHHTNQRLAELKEQYDLARKQMAAIERQVRGTVERLQVTEAVLQAYYQFTPAVMKTYYLYWDKRKERYVLNMLGPDDWSCGMPDHWEYHSAVRLLGDSTWEPVELERPVGEPETINAEVIDAGESGR